MEGRHDKVCHFANVRAEANPFHQVLDVCEKRMIVIICTPKRSPVDHNPQSCNRSGLRRYGRAS